MTRKKPGRTSIIRAVAAKFIARHSVTIRAKTAEQTQEEEGEYYCHEISRGEFSRTLSLPADVNADKAKAVFKDGILNLTLPKLERSKRQTVKVE